MSACFFIGHRGTGESILPVLAKEIERHITEYSVTEFVVGHYGGFDRLRLFRALRASRGGDRARLRPAHGTYRHRPFAQRKKERRHKFQKLGVYLQSGRRRKARKDRLERFSHS